MTARALRFDLPKAGSAPTFEARSLHQRLALQALPDGLWKLSLSVRRRTPQSFVREESSMLYWREAEGGRRILEGEPPIALELRGPELAISWASLHIEGIEVSSPPYSPGVTEPPRWRLRIREDGAERCYFGLGERTGGLNRRGRSWVNWCTDEPRHDPQADPLYQAHPFLLTTEENGAAWGLFLDSSWWSRFQLAAPQEHQSTIEVDGPELTLILIPGPRPAEVIARYSALVGRSHMPPLWSLGFHQCRWSYPEAESLRELARRFEEHDLPGDALWLDIDALDQYRSLTLSPSRFPEPRQLFAELRESGFRVVSIVDPALSADPSWEVYNEGLRRRAYITTERDEVLVGRVWPRRAVWPDFSRLEVREWWAELQRPVIEAGLAGLWNDMNEPALFALIDADEKEHPTREFPKTARHGAASHAELHNLYGSQMAQASYEGLRKLHPERRPFVLTRAGFAGIQKHAFVWTGDNGSSWEQMRQSIPMLLGLSLSGVSLIGADIGGFFGRCEAELLVRWTWLGVFYPFMRNHSAKDYGPQEPWIFDSASLEAIRQALLLRYRLLPYLYTQCYLAHQTGAPILRPLLYSHPEDPRARRCDSEFYFGPDLLIAPILEAGQDRRMVYLPEGLWEDFFTGERHQGPAHIVAAAEWPKIPVFQRAGSAIPLWNLPQGERVRSRDAHWEDLRWRVSLGADPRARIHGELYSDSGEGPVDGALLRLAIAPGSEDDPTWPGARPLILESWGEALLMKGGKFTRGEDGLGRWHRSGIEAL